MRGYWILLALLILPCVEGAVNVGATVGNAEPSILLLEPNVLYVSPDDRRVVSEAVLCGNQGNLRYHIVGEGVDLNSYTEISFPGAFQYRVMGYNSTGEWQVSGYNNLIFTTGSGVNASYYHFFDMTHSHEELNGTSSYGLEGTISDLASFSELESGRFTFEKQDCLGKVMSGVVPSGELDLLADTGTHLTFHSSAPVAGMVWVRTSRNCPMLPTNSYARCLYLEMTPGLEGSISGIDLVLEYYALGNVNENSLRLYSWEGAFWRQITPFTKSKAMNVLSGGISRSGWYSIQGKEKDYGCKERWECGSWGKCRGGKMTRKCKDLNKCGTEQSKPVTWQGCSSSGYADASLPIVPEEEDMTPIPDLNILFDINIELIDGEVISGDELLMKVALLNFGDAGTVTVDLTYTIANGTGTHYFETDEVTLETQVEFLKSLPVDHLGDGEYTVHVDLKYPTQTEPAEASKDFVIDRSSDLNLIMWVVVGLLLLLLVLMLYAYFHHHIHKDHHGPKGESEESR
jgi:hypothetical protein